MESGWHEACSSDPANGIRVCKGDRLMMDILFLVVAIGFFAGAIAYVEGCERL
jgi:K+-transporting ATPase KdpF subunit